MNPSPGNLSSFGVAEIDFGIVHGVAPLRFVKFSSGAGSLEVWSKDGRWLRDNAYGADWFTSTRVDAEELVRRGVDPFKPGDLWPKSKGA